MFYSLQTMLFSGFKTIQCNSIKNSSSENTIICLCMQSKRVRQILALLSAEVSLFLSSIIIYKEVQSLLFLFLKKKFKNIHLFIECHLLIWVDNYAHSTSLYTICISENKSIFVTYIQKIQLKYEVNVFYITHTGAFLTLLPLIESEN